MSGELVSTRLAELETVIERGQQTFVEVGNALAEIRDQRLYKETHATFEAYCRERWGFGRNYANKQIAAAHGVAALGTDVPIPKTEGEARALLTGGRSDLTSVRNHTEVDPPSVTAPKAVGKGSLYEPVCSLLDQWTEAVRLSRLMIACPEDEYEYQRAIVDLLENNELDLPPLPQPRGSVIPVLRELQQIIDLTDEFFALAKLWQAREDRKMLETANGLLSDEVASDEDCAAFGGKPGATFAQLSRSFVYSDEECADMGVAPGTTAAEVAREERQEIEERARRQAVAENAAAKATVRRDEQRERSAARREAKKRAAAQVADVEP